jgi:hypothetical protein
MVKIKELLKHLSGVIEKHCKILSQDIQPAGSTFNPGPPKYKAGVLTTQLQHSNNMM